MQKKVAKNTYDIFDNCDYQKFQRESAIIRYLHQSIDHDYEADLMCIFNL